MAYVDGKKWKNYFVEEGTRAWKGWEEECEKEGFCRGRVNKGGTREAGKRRRINREKDKG